MKISVSLIDKSLREHSRPDTIPQLMRFFKAVPGGYGEGDRFLGVRVPDQRKVANRFYRDISLPELAGLLESPWHEHRLTALFMMVLRYQKARKSSEQAEIKNLYLKYLDNVNNWDLVDSSADKILGAWCWAHPHDKVLLEELSGSENLWHQRVAIIACLYFIRQQSYSELFGLAERLMHHPHDLMHKAIGWMIRECWKRDGIATHSFILMHYREMPRTMLRYAIEKYPEDQRQAFLKGVL